MSWGDLIGAAIGGYASYAGQGQANELNVQIARENRDWQERMSNTAYQRAGRDLQAAGLNRILALGSPSSTPAGNVATMQNKAGAGIQSALATAQIAVAQAQANKLKEETYPLKVKNDAVRGALSQVAPKGVQSAVGGAFQGAGRVMTYALSGDTDHKPAWIERILPHGATTDPDQNTARLNPLTIKARIEVMRAYRAQVRFNERDGRKLSREYKDLLLKELMIRKRRGESLRHYITIEDYPGYKDN